MERVELGCSGGVKEYGSITTLLRGEVALDYKNMDLFFWTKLISTTLPGGRLAHLYKNMTFKYLIYKGVWGGGGVQRKL